MTATDHNIASSYREMLLEHLFAGEIMRHLWLNGVRRMEVLKPQVDDGGYDIVLEAKGVVRHVQLKASHIGAATASVKVNVRLSDKPSGCIIWVQFDPKNLKLGPFYFFGDEPGKPLPSLDNFNIAKHSKANSKGVKSERPRIRVIPKEKFTKITSVGFLVTKLFG